MDPFINQTLVEMLGLNENLWSLYKYQTDNFTEWPIKNSVQDHDLWQKTTFGSNDIIEGVGLFWNNTMITLRNFSDEYSGELLKIRVKLLIFKCIIWVNT
jgi:hypothetical protein